MEYKQHIRRENIKYVRFQLLPLRSHWHVSIPMLTKYSDYPSAVKEVSSRHAMFHLRDGRPVDEACDFDTCEAMRRSDMKLERYLRKLGVIRSW